MTAEKPGAALLAGAKGVPRSLGIGDARHWTRIAESLLSTTHPVVSQGRPGLPCLFCGRHSDLFYRIYRLFQKGKGYDETETS